MKPAGDSEYRCIEVPVEELKQALVRSLNAPMAESDYRNLEAALDTLAHLTELLADKDITIDDLRQLLFPSSPRRRAPYCKTPASTLAMVSQQSQRRSRRSPATDGTQPRTMPGHGESKQRIVVVQPRTDQGPVGPGTREQECLDEKHLRSTMQSFDELWKALNIDEQRSMLRPLVERVGYDSRTGKVTVSFKSESIKDLCQNGALR